MTVLTAKRISTDKEAKLLCDEPSFADALAAIQAAQNLTRTQKSHWATSLRRMARYLQRAPEMVPARISAISTAVSKLHPEQLGANAKTFANHRANVRSALLWYNLQTRGTGRGASMDRSYRHLLAQIEDRHQRDLLSPFFRYLSAIGVEPNKVADPDVEQYASFKRETSFGAVHVGNLRRLVRCWNARLKAISGWPHNQLTEPLSARLPIGPCWEQFPLGLRSDIEAYCARIARRRKSATGRLLQPCAPSTIAMRRRQLVATVKAAVASGLYLNDLQSLRALCRPDRVEAVIDYYWKRNGTIPGTYAMDLAGRFLEIAREEALEASEVECLDEFRLLLEKHRSKGLTEKNRTFIRQVNQGHVWSKVVSLPARVMARTRLRARSSPVRAAVTAELAVAVRILVVAPVRIGNLASIKLGYNLIRPGGAESNYVLVFPNYDVKNQVPLEFPLDAETTSIIDEYVDLHRPALLRDCAHQFLFPGKGNARKATPGLGNQLSNLLRKELGLKITPHQFRHAAAAIMLKHEPGNYELVRRVLGHRNIQTTIDFYVGLETLEATRRFSRLVLGDMVSAPSPTYHSRSVAAGHV